MRDSDDPPPIDRTGTSSQRSNGNGERVLTTKIVSRIAAKEGVTPAELKPLYTAINPDALEDLFASSHRTSRQSRGHVVFEYIG